MTNPTFLSSKLLGLGRQLLGQFERRGRFVPTWHGLAFCSLALGCGAAGDGPTLPVVQDPPPTRVDPVVPRVPVLMTPERSTATPPSAPSQPLAEVADLEKNCDQRSVELETMRRPVDVIAVFDNSGGMEEEARAFEQNIHESFVAILDASVVDYRLILISEYAPSPTDDAALCVSAPFSPQVECTGDEPAFSERFFHFSTSVGSEDSLEILLDTFAAREDDFDLAPEGWSTWLRPGAGTVILEFTDDDSELSTQEFLSDLSELSPERFGDPGAPSFVFHSVVGLAEKGGGTDAYLPAEPVEGEECESNGGDVDNAGEVYQELSRLTGGLRFPICQFDAYDSVLRQLAADVVRVSRVPCEFQIPDGIPGGAVAAATTEVQYLLAGEEPVTVFEVSESSGCDAGGYVLSGSRLSLCPNTCSAVNGEEQATVELSSHGCSEGEEEG